MPTVIYTVICMNYFIPSILIIFSLTACSSANIFKGQGDYWRNHAADSVVCTVDTGVKDEVDKNKPSGYLLDPYSPELWNESWNIWINSVGVRNPTLPESYAGPSNRTIVLYMLQLRRENGLPDLTPSDKTKKYLEEAYESLSNTKKDSCFWLKRKSPVCFLSPADYPGELKYQRSCENGV